MQNSRSYRKPELRLCTDKRGHFGAFIFKMATCQHVIRHDRRHKMLPLLPSIFSHIRSRDESDKHF